METLKFSPNQFGGVVTNVEALPDDPREFKRLLHLSLDTWATKGYKVVWLELPIGNASLVPVAVAAGFEYHHAESEYVLMTLQIVPGSYIPPYATHYIGAGAVVLNERDEILVVVERYRMGPSRGPGYKLPGGALHPGEHLVDGAVREVREETGVHAKFESLAWLPPLAWIPVREVRHLLRVPTVCALYRDHDAGGGDRRVPLDAGRRVPVGGVRHSRIQQEHRQGGASQPWHSSRKHIRLRRPRPIRVLHAAE